MAFTSLATSCRTCFLTAFLIAGLMVTDRFDEAEADL